jgi:hypothetical protein
MDRSSRDMIMLVDSISRKMRSVIPRYQRKVTQNLPNPKGLKEMVLAHEEVSKRYNAGDFRHTSREFGLLAELAQYLVNLHSATEGTPQHQLTMVEANMVIREKTIG